jgi:Na+/citrate or Na+/malate symporter
METILIVLVVMFLFGGGGSGILPLSQELVAGSRCDHERTAVKVDRSEIFRIASYGVR